MPLHQYVDFFPYCNELSEITGLSIEIVIQIVTNVFKKIQEGKIDSVIGFKQIEEQLGEQMLYNGFIVKTTIEQQPEEKEMVPAF